MELLARSQQKFYVHAIRDEGAWAMQERTRMAAEYEFVDYAVEEKGKMKAFFRTSVNPENRELFLREITDADQVTAQSVLDFLKDKGRQNGLETLVAQTSYADAFTEYLVAIGGVQCLPAYAWQIRVTDYAGMFLKMKPLFERRLAASPYRHLTDKVSFNFYRFAVQLTIEYGAITDVENVETSEDNKIRINPLVFTQLMLGHRSREELEAVFPDVLVKPDYKELVDVLFPKLPSHIHCAY
jgi:hypothetical protein